MRASEPLGSSFRDPSGFLFTRDGLLYRQVNTLYKDVYRDLMGSGLYETLVEIGLLIAHQEGDDEPAEPETAYTVLRPETVPFISYPYEWCFSQLKDAALATLEIQKLALSKGFSLKDSSAYNIQFHHGRPVLIDTLSFELYQEGQPWVAYRQFCQHFLAPLTLMALRDVRLGQLTRVHLDGIPIDLASRLLPVRSYWNFGLLTHLHLHARAQQRYAGTAVGAGKTARQMSRIAFLGLLDNLEATVKKLTWDPAGTQWGRYYEVSASHYSDRALEHKKEIVTGFLARIQPEDVWDLGANTGLFSRLASDQGIPTVAFDLDPGAVEVNYRESRKQDITNLLPLVLDLTNPSPAIGWQNRERQSFLERGTPDAVLALALIHHLAIVNNLPLERLADFFHKLSRWLVIEFVPKGDPQVQRLLSSREDIFERYHEDHFQEAFGRRYTIQDCIQIQDTPRKVYLMEAH